MGFPGWLNGKRKNKICLPIQEMCIQSPGREDPLKKERTTHSSILAWKIPWTEGPGRLQSMGSQRFRNNWVTEQQQYSNHCYPHHHRVPGNKRPLQRENQMLSMSCRGWPRTNIQVHTCTCKQVLNKHDQWLKTQFCFYLFLNFILWEQTSHSLEWNDWHIPFMFIYFMFILT